MSDCAKVHAKRNTHIRYRRRESKYEKALRYAFWTEVFRLILKWVTTIAVIFIVVYSMYRAGLYEHPGCDPSARMFTTIVQAGMVGACFFLVKICFNGFKKN